MAILMISEVAGQTPAGYDGLFEVVGAALKVAPGLKMHMSHATDDGWRVIEVWDTQNDATRFFASHIAPHLPEGIRPKLSFQPLHDLLQP